MAAELRRLWFRAADSDDVAASKGKEAAGLLGHTIWWHFHERLKGRNDLRVVHLSCHDYTIAGLAALFGVDLEQVSLSKNCTQDILVDAL